MRQAYDYWQDQPDNRLRENLRTPSIKNRERNATLFHKLRQSFPLALRPAHNRLIFSPRQRIEVLLREFNFRAESEDHRETINSPLLGSEPFHLQLSLPDSRARCSDRNGETNADRHSFCSTVLTLPFLHNKLCNSMLRAFSGRAFMNQEWLRTKMTLERPRARPKKRMKGEHVQKRTPANRRTHAVSSTEGKRFQSRCNNFYRTEESPQISKNLGLSLIFKNRPGTCNFFQNVKKLRKNLGLVIFFKICKKNLEKIRNL